MPKVFPFLLPVSAKSSNKFFCIRFECHHHLTVSPSLNLHSQNERVPFIGHYYLPKFWLKKPKATTKVTLKATNDPVLFDTSFGSPEWPLLITSHKWSLARGRGSLYDVTSCLAAWSLSLVPCSFWGSLSRDLPDLDPPLQRSPWTENPLDRDPVDRDSLDRDSLTNTPCTVRILLEFLFDLFLPLHLIRIQFLLKLLFSSSHFKNTALPGRSSCHFHLCSFRWQLYFYRFPYSF